MIVYLFQFSGPGTVYSGSATWLSGHSDRKQPYSNRGLHSGAARVRAGFLGRWWDMKFNTGSPVWVAEMLSKPFKGQQFVILTDRILQLWKVNNYFILNSSLRVSDTLSLRDSMVSLESLLPILYLRCKTRIYDVSSIRWMRDLLFSQGCACRHCQAPLWLACYFYTCKSKTSDTFILFMWVKWQHISPTFNLGRGLISHNKWKTSVWVDSVSKVLYMHTGHINMWQSVWLKAQMCSTLLTAGGWSSLYF